MEKLDALLATRQDAAGYDPEFDRLWEEAMKPEPPPKPPSYLKRLTTTTTTSPPWASTTQAGNGPAGRPPAPPTTTDAAAKPPAKKRAPRVPTVTRRKPPAIPPRVIADIPAPAALRKAVAQRRRAPSTTAAAQGLPDLAAEPTPDAVATSQPATPTRMAPPARRQVPRVGTSIQRSSATCSRKIEALMGLTTPPPRRPAFQTRPLIRPPAVAAIQAAVSHRKQAQLDKLFGDLSDLDLIPTTPADGEATKEDRKSVV